MSQPLYPVQGSQLPPNNRLDGPQNPSGCSGDEKKKYLASAGIRTPDRPSHILVNVAATLPHLLSFVIIVFNVLDQQWQTSDTHAIRITMRKLLGMQNFVLKQYLDKNTELVTVSIYMWVCRGESEICVPVSGTAQIH
jgi:hypothetical protein